MFNKIILSTIAVLTISSVNASDYYYEERGIINNNINATYQYSRKEYVNDNITLKPISVYTGKTVTVTKHYDVYKPMITYTKVGSYDTQTECND